MEMKERNYMNTKVTMILPFVVDEINQQHKQAMIDKFIYDRIDRKGQLKGNPDRPVYNTSYDDPEYKSIICNKFINLIKDNFDNLDHQINEVMPWIYVQNNIHYKSEWHNHDRTSTINAVFYIDPPKDGGELCISYPPVLGNVVMVKPEVNKIYIFPYWLYHKPMPQKDSHWRISVNLEYHCSPRPIIKGETEEDLQKADERFII